ncbi:MAG: peptidase M14 [Alphaproteobacteria bacterium]|nr:peptidase M14 [Alphaproteobacteria bacterium]
MAKAANSRIMCDLDWNKPGRQVSVLRVPQSRDDAGWGTVEIPIMVTAGSEARGKGPTVLFTGGVHGDEYEGQIAISRLARSLDPRRLKGRVIMIPAVDLPAALAGRRLCPLDNRDLNRCFPGDPRGTFCQMLAHYIDSVILPMVDVSVDVHSAGHSADSALSTNMHHRADATTMKRTLALAAAFGAPYNVVFWGVDEGATLTSSVERRQILSIGTELGGYGRVSVDGVRVAERGLANVLKHLGMIAGKPETAQADGAAGTRHMMVRDNVAYTFCPAEGLFEPRHTAGTSVKKGATAGLVHFVEDPSREPIELKYRQSGVLWMAMGPGRCRKGDTLAVVMRDYEGG